MDIITIKDLTFTYPNAEAPALAGISLSVPAGAFLVLCGPSGCGKSTLLQHCKPQLTPHGSQKGTICYKNTPMAAMPARTAAAAIGFVRQSPEHQIVTDKVWHELAFGLESLGMDTPTIRRRVAETASFLGIEHWFYKNVADLSGGQKQLLNLAAVMVTQPEVLILDEPTAQLDPIAASAFLQTLQKINRELGTTVIISEHRLEEVLPMATSVAVMENGNLLCCGAAAAVGAYLQQTHSPMLLSMPAAMRIWSAAQTDAVCPVSVNEGKRFLSDYAATHVLQPVPSRPAHAPQGTPAITAREVYFRYEKDGKDILNGLELTAYAGELLCILGGNGAGKSTMLKALAGVCRPYRGTVRTTGRLCCLPQEPQTLFLKKTLYDDLADTLKDAALTVQARRERLANTLALCRLQGLEQRHPYDLSGGEQQRAALAKLLLLKPEILLLDEPTKGMDGGFKRLFAAILRDLRAAGVCIVMVSHDAEFCAAYADRCAMFFDGNLISLAPPQEFFRDNQFYTTAAGRIAKGIAPDAVTAEDIIAAIGGKREDLSAETIVSLPDSVVLPRATPTAKLPLWRKIGAAVFAAISMLLFILAAKSGELTALADMGGVTPMGKNQLLYYGGLLLSLLLTAVCAGGRTKKPPQLQPPANARRLSKRTVAAVVCIVLLIPLTLFISVVYMDRKQYYLSAFAVLLECMLPFFLVFEGRKPRAREITVIAALCALGIVGRAAFFMLPQFKPVLALTVIAGVALGGETGFLVGAVTMLASNVLFSQGPWTPWQMFAMGLIGFLAGVLYNVGLLRRSRLSLCLFGAVSALLIYGGIMNPAAALVWGGEVLNFNMLVGYYVTGFPLDCVHAAATAIFLWFLSLPMLEKLDRIKEKYGLMA
ncbi:MAG: ATP-binding cassette domain-containing protein [Clostridia bacterium]|nr:ATP-binding cassette domain-containing protein [Clostridia bacterium]